MISDLLGSISGAVTFATASLLLLLTTFVVIIVWTLRLRRPDLVRYSRLPLDDACAHGTEEEGVDAHDHA